MHHYISVLRLNFRHVFPRKKVKKTKLLKCKCIQCVTQEHLLHQSHIRMDLNDNKLIQRVTLYILIRHVLECVSAWFMWVMVLLRNNNIWGILRVAYDHDHVFQSFLCQMCRRWHFIFQCLQWGSRKNLRSPGWWLHSLPRRCQRERPIQTSPASQLLWPSKRVGLTV